MSMVICSWRSQRKSLAAHQEVRPRVEELEIPNKDMREGLSLSVSASKLTYHWFPDDSVLFITEMNDAVILGCIRVRIK